MENHVFNSYDPVSWWIDRLGNMEFLEDQKGDVMNPAFYWHMIRLADKTGFNSSALM